MNIRDEELEPFFLKKLILLVENYNLNFFTKMEENFWIKLSFLWHYITDILYVQEVMSIH